MLFTGCSRYGGSCRRPEHGAGIDVGSAFWSEEPDFEERLARIARDLVNEPDLEHTLQRVADAAAASLNGRVWASVSLVQARREVETPASTDDRATRADQLQYEMQDGPCLDAIREQETFQVDDMTTDQRYSRWTTAVAGETGIRAVCRCSCSPMRSRTVSAR